MAGTRNSTLTYDESRDRGDDDFPSPVLVVAMECSRPLAAPGRYSIAEVDEVVIGRANDRGHLRYSNAGRGGLRIDVPDSWMSGDHIRLQRDGDAWLVRDCGSKNGTFVNGTRIDRAVMVDGDLIEAGNTLFLHCAGSRRSFREQADVVVDPAMVRPAALATLNAALSRRLDELERVAPTGVPVLIGGESGTGKEMLARAVHELSGREGPFVPLNCGALAPTIIESELFGHRKGAFSGASEARPGFVRAADGGTLFLDEVAELPESSQVKLLRVLQEKEVVPVGETRAIKVDVRVVAATHQDLPARVTDGRFRQDLFARLAGFEVGLPPLRARREDIGLLVAALLPRVAGGAAASIKLERAAGRLLFCYDWPLNIRELEQALAAAVALADGNEIGPEHLPAALRGEGPLRAPLDEDDVDLRARLTELLETHRGNVSAIAREMGKARVQVRRWCKRFGLNADDYR